MGAILCGTASWTDKSLIEAGAFYPDEVRTPEERLRFYADRFPLVEVDSTYYGLPTPRNALLWIDRTPPGFVFDVKAFRLFTQHQTEPRALPKDVRQALGTSDRKNVYYRDIPEELLGELWQRFRLGIEPLCRAGKLGVVLFQFPPWFVPSKANFEHLAACSERLPGTRLAVEFRNKAWFEGDRPERVFEFEREHGLAHVVVDEPQGFTNSVPALWQVTCPEVAVLRLHGRNRLTWDATGLSSAERFNYLYDRAELEELAASARTLGREARSVHVLFNNCYTDYAQRNALDFRQLIDREP